MTYSDAALARIARRRAKGESTLLAANKHNAKVALEKTKAETKSRKSLKKYHDQIKREGKRSAVTSSARPLSVIKADLNIWEYSAADDLLAAYRKSLGEPVARDPDAIDIPLAQIRFDAADEHAAQLSDLAKAYQGWRAALASTSAFAVTKDVLFAERSLAAVDKANRWRKGTARKHLGAALRHFASIRGNTPRGAHDWKYDPSNPLRSIEKEMKR